MFKGKFQIEDGSIYEGYTNGNHWNGWACPYFTRQIAEQIAREVNADAPDCTMCYDKANDAFIYKANGDECVYKANEAQKRNPLCKGKVRQNQKPARVCSIPQGKRKL